MRRVILAAVVAAVALAPATAQAHGHHHHHDGAKAYRHSVSVRDMLRHEYALQRIADANDGTRVAGTSGNDQTVDYIAHTMRRARWNVRVQPFEFPFFQELSDPVFEQTAPSARTFTQGDDFVTMQFSGSGDVTAPVVPVDVVVPIGSNPPNTSTSGCEAADYAGFPAGSIALLQRGTCPFGQKAQNAEDAGASAVIIFNEGQEGRTEVVDGTLGAPAGIPVIGTTFDLGAELVDQYRNSQSPAAHIATETLNETRTTYNVIADSPWGDPDRTVVVSAHNDSVAAGPGINDDGSGTSMDLELARELGRHGKRPGNHVRFLWVGAEEEGLLGSTYYVEHLSDAERAQIIAMLDFDMVASPNYARQVYDGDGSTFGSDLSGPNGSGFIEKLFNTSFASRDQASEPIPFDGRSDYVAFTDAGIPAGGIFTGAEKIKTEEEQQLFGGTAGEPLDPCYHQACDTIHNLNLKAFGEMKDAAADTLWTLAHIRGPITDDRDVPSGGDGHGHRHGHGHGHGHHDRGRGHGHGHHGHSRFYRGESLRG